MPKRYLTGGGKSLKKQEKSINYAIKTSKTTKYFLQQFIEKITNLYLKLTFAEYDKIGGEGPSAQIIYQICVDNLNELNPNNLKEAPRAQRKSENKDNHDKGSLAIKSSGFCVDDSNDLNKIEREAPRAERGSADQGNHNEEPFAQKCGFDKIEQRQRHNKEQKCIFTESEPYNHEHLAIRRNFTIFVRKITNLYLKLKFCVYDKIGGEAPRAQGEYENRGNHDKGSRTIKSSGFCVGDSNDLNKIGGEASRAPIASVQAGDYHPKSAFQSYLSNFVRNGFIKNLFLFCPLRPSNLLNSRGAVLIEFAVCMPILIILLFYINDLVRIKRYYSQTEFVAQQMANMIQNISQKRDDKTITADDLRYIYVLAYKSIVPGNFLFYRFSNYELGCLATCYVHYFVGLSDGTPSRKWSGRLYAESSTSPKTVQYNQTMSYSKSPWPAKMDPGEVKIVVEVSFAHNPYYKWGSQSSSTAQEVFLLHFISPKAYGWDNGNHWRAYFNSAVTFVPKPGLFTETMPK